MGGSGIPLLSLGSEGEVQGAPALRRELQERQVAGSKADVFASVLHVLADAGFRVTQADANTGFITATGAGEERISIGFGGLSRDSETPAVSIFVDDGRAEDSNVVRAIFARSRISSTSRGSTAETLVSDEAPYRAFFANLEREVHVRREVREQIALQSLPSKVSGYEETRPPDRLDLCEEPAVCEGPEGGSET